MGWMGPQGGKRVSSGGVGAGRRPFLVRPDSSAPFKRPDGKRAPVAHGHREVGALARARPAREEAAPDPFGRIEPANRTLKKGLVYRRASAGLGRLRREPDPCVRRRSGAGTHSARGCMGPAEFGNAGLSP